MALVAVLGPLLRHGKSLVKKVWKITSQMQHCYKNGGLLGIDPPTIGFAWIWPTNGIQLVSSNMGIKMAAINLGLSTKWGCNRQRWGVKTSHVIVDVDVCNMTIYIYIYIYLSGWWFTYPSEKDDLVSWDDEIPNIWNNKTCSKPPITYVIFRQQNGRLADLAAEVTKQFKRRGFTVNFAPGKTSAVVSFVGKDAPELRRQHLLDRIQVSPSQSMPTTLPGLALPLSTSIWEHNLQPVIPLKQNYGNGLACRRQLSANCHGWSWAIDISQLGSEFSSCNRWFFPSSSTAWDLGTHLLSGNCTACAPHIMGCCGELCDLKLMNKSRPNSS